MKGAKRYPAKNPKELADRLLKYSGGQILLETKEGEIQRGQIIKYGQEGNHVRFELAWLATKRTVTKNPWYLGGGLKSWKWELIKPTSDVVSNPQSKDQVRVTLPQSVEAQGFGNNASENKKGFTVTQIQQTKTTQALGIVFPKCMFSVTDSGDKFTLFQPSDPRNLRLENGRLIDPALPAEQQT